VLKGVQPHEIPFSTSVFARNSVVELSNNMKTLCAVHVITKYGTIFFASTALQQVLLSISKNNNNPDVLIN
jgi:hypothetical protein